jgi:hypothetical protein
VLNRLASTAAARLIALAMLLTVAFHALQPVSRPLEVIRGSAFSASTTDVAAAPGRRVLPERIAVSAFPAALPVPASEIVLAPAIRVAGHAARPDTAAPPPVRRVRSHSPRGPPTA